ncbi:(Fe-S)-binding protein [Anaeromyxobacter diazotrophicus]|uniref:Fe-S oxidoreductase n=1 Tax=Anaeromyxobacter diazotrophicus TaxID=2590199 RepID=A0A7I9VND2_9BACT|nr:(Fe-S)-binding protein [Anaeromyxobacter diazotrophicus]GEJ57913.1 Fe-S oxidoreductase [Anaeromyxobacter diazotrophicus]
MLTVGLFIPCYIEQLYPEVGLATVRVLERHGVRVEYPEDQTCCGQPMSNTGCTEEARPLAEKFLRLFRGYEHVVAPSGSCVSMVRNHYDGFLAGQPGFDHLKRSTWELCEFLVDVLKLPRLEGAFPHKVGLHQSCHGLRELRLGSGSERRVAPFNKVQLLLSELRGLQLVELARQDECCGFGGTFAVQEEAVSCMMGRDRLADHERAGAEIVTGVDMSCLMHLDGLIRRERRPLQVLHVAQLLDRAEAAA